jgi:hypothetical protein
MDLINHKIKGKTKMISIMTWHAPSQNGAFQKNTELGIYSDLLTVKPTFSFEFTSMNYIEQNNTFDIDGVPMDDAQKAEVLSQIEAVVVPVEWKKNVRKQEAISFLNSTEYKFNDDYDRKETAEWLELKTKRQEARELIRSIEAQ